MRYICLITLLLLKTVLGATENEELQDKAAALYSRGLTAMSKNNFKEARTAFLDLIEHYAIPQTVAEEALLGIIKAEIGLKDYVAARAKLMQLLQKPLFPFMNFRTKLLEARLAFAEHNLDIAWKILKEQEAHCPLKDWPEEERVLYLTIQLLKE